MPLGMDPKIVEVYRGVGKLLSRYTAGKVRYLSLRVGRGRSWGTEASAPVLHVRCYTVPHVCASLLPPSPCGPAFALDLSLPASPEAPLTCFPLGKLNKLVLALK